MENANLLMKALRISQKAHNGQFRKSKHEFKYPYFQHPAMVVRFVNFFGGTENDMVVAYLHDVVEDCSEKGFDLNFIEKKFGVLIAHRVDELTNKKVDPITGLPLRDEVWQQEKKKIQAIKAQTMSKGDQLVKVCDQLSNIIDFVTLEPKDNSVESRIKYVDGASKVIFACDKLSDRVMSYAKKICATSLDFLQQEKSGFFKGKLAEQRLMLRTSWIDAIKN